ncbi:MAG: glycoside hydrolase family 127 protein [Kiritimatiellales bacterium]|nr:glycoside hydrolase family 127 protein [Kiritimatiellales bacterium]
MARRVMSQDIERIIRPYRERFEETAADWRCEYWGKWVTSAALGYAYQPTPGHRAVIDRGVKALLSTQTPDGYIGTYKDDKRLGTWDVWGRKYTLLGLLAYYDLTGDHAVLDAACRHADCLIREAPPGVVNLSENGHEALMGLPASSILEPVTRLYQRTGEQRYLDFAKRIVSDWSRQTMYFPAGPQLIEQALAGVPPSQMGSRKAYEMMSCFEGLCEVYRITGDRRLLDAAVAFAQSIRRLELMIHGSASNQELWCDGARLQTESLEEPTETCVTVTWMKLCDQLLRLTGDPLWADELEISLYNALLGSMTPGGEWWAYFSPLQGQRVPSHYQHDDVQMSCCAANGPRGLLLTPRWAVMGDDEGIVVNLYAPGTARHTLTDGTLVELMQETDYPVGGRITISVSPSMKKTFPVRLRIPAWSRNTTLEVNGQPVAWEAGCYATIAREWSPGDKISLSLDLRGRAIAAPSGAPQFAVMRGPVLLAMDNRIAPPQDLAVWLATDSEGFVELTPATSKPDDIWMAFEVPFEVRPSHYFNHYTTSIALCDYASAGNKWCSDNLFRVWLPRPLFLRHAYPDGTWKIMCPGKQACPGMPMQSPSAEAGWQ